MKLARALLVVVLLAFVGHAMPAVVVADGRVFRQPYVPRTPAAYENGHSSSRQLWP